MTTEGSERGGAGSATGNGPQDGPRGGEDGVWLLYDGHCPFCSSYARYVRLRESVGELRLLDARSDDLRARQIQAETGFDLDQGMVLRLGGRTYHGADCLHVLAGLSSRSGLFNKLNAAVFRRRALARLLYPVLRAGRNATLGLLGRARFGAGRPAP